MYRSMLLVVSILLPIIANAQQLADGLIVPFTSDLPSCASKCGPLSDVQGACVPPVTAATDSGCFCADPRLKPFLQGPSGVSQVCGAASCTSNTDLQKVQTWYQSYCNVKTATTTTSSSGGGTASSSSSSGTVHQSWMATHYKWVIMLIILVVGITSAWILAFYFRRRYLLRREREIEMRPPVALGPHQIQGMTGGYAHENGADNANDGGHYKEAARAGVSMTPADATRGKKESKGLQKKQRE